MKIFQLLPKSPLDNKTKHLIRRLWINQFPTQGQKEILKISGNLSLLEKVVITVLQLRMYVSLGYIAKYFIHRDCHTQYIELYIFVRDVLLVLALCYHSNVMSFPYSQCIPALIAWATVGSLLFPIRVVFVDRYAENWAPRSSNRSLLFVLVHYIEIIIGFAYMYVHFGLLRYTYGCKNIVTSVWDSLYFSVVTITTLGYGDIRPTEGLGHKIAMLEPIFGIVLLVMVVGLFFVELGRIKSE